MRKQPPTTAAQLEPEQIWAYRAHWNDPLIPVRVRRVGERRPARALVRFVGDEFEGLEEWVPPARLKCRWESVEDFTARELRWEAVTSQSPPIDSPVESAASAAFDLLIDPGLATLGYSATGGLTFIHDLAGLAALLDEDPEELRLAPSSFEEGGVLIVPWSVTERIARRAVGRDPHATLRNVEREE